MPNGSLGFASRGIALHSGVQFVNGKSQGRKRKETPRELGVSEINMTFIAAIESGETGIRTLGTLAGTPVFKTGAIGRSAISPGRMLGRTSHSVNDSAHHRHKRLATGSSVPRTIRRRDELAGQSILGMRDLRIGPWRGRSLRPLVPDGPPAVLCRSAAT